MSEFKKPETSSTVQQCSPKLIVDIIDNSALADIPTKLLTSNLNVPDFQNIPAIQKQTLSLTNRKIVRSRLRIKKHFQKWRQERSKLLAAIVDNPLDIRPYAELTILGNRYTGLLDTGASISCIGGTLASKFIKDNEEFKPLSCSVRTADGKSQQIIGRLTTTVCFKQHEKEISFYIVPSLSQPLYLGIDFWKAFDLLPHCLLQNEISALDDPLLRPLSDKERQQLEATVKLFPSFAKKGLGRTTVLSHSIDVADAIPIKQRHFPVSPAIERIMYEELDRMLELDVIEESNSAWSSPVVLVRKPGKVRLCLDSRKVNAITVKDAYPMPFIDGILSRLPKAEFISSLDLKDAFWQIPLDPKSRDKTAFSVPGRPLYQYKVMPFGLCNAPQTMSKLMDKIIPAHLRREVFIYLDDLLIVSDTFERHLSTLRELASQLTKSGLTINVEKSKFCLKQVQYLGHIVGHGTIATDPEKLSAIVDFPVPRSVKQLRRFLGMTGWYHKFIKNYASIASPLTDTLKQKRKFEWSDEAQKAFELLKKQMCEAPVLHSPNFDAEFFLHCDASHTGVGGVLVQLNAEGNEVPIAFMSKKLNQSQRNYSVTEKECLAAILAIKKFRAYIEGQKFTIVTDHASLKWLMSQTDLSSRLARWALRLQGFTFEIKHRKGSQNIVPDALSRTFTEDLASMDLDQFIDLEADSFRSIEYEALVKQVKQNENKLPDVKVVNNIIYRRMEHATGDRIADDMVWKIWLPKDVIPIALRLAHDHPLASHCGINKTLERLRRYYFWPNLVTDVRAYINSCEICKCTKHPNHTLRPTLSKTGESQRFFQKLYVDFLGPYPRSKSGNIGVFVVLDHFSKFPFLKPVKKFTADAILKYVEEDLLHCFGVPEVVVSDNGVQFKSHAFNNLLRKYNISHSYTAVYAPQGNASERVNRSVIAAIKAYISPSQNNWDEQLSKICCSLRSSWHSAINITPYKLTFGQNMITNGSTFKLLKNLEMLEDRSVCFNREDSFNIEREKAITTMRKQHQRNENNSQWVKRSIDATFPKAISR